MNEHLVTTLNGLPADVPGLWERYADTLAARGVERPKVVVHGGYGKRNMGDDAILHVLLGRVRQHLPGATVTVVCHGPERVREWYPDVSAHHFKSFGALMAALRSDVYIVGGGGIVNRINAYSGNMVLKVLDPKGKFQFLNATLAGWTGALTHYYAIGCESFPDAAVRGIARFGLQRADTVSVRDPRTYRNLRQIGVTRELVQVRDPALSLDPAPVEDAVSALASLGLPAKGERIRPLVGMNFRWVGDPEVDNERTMAEAVRLARWLDERGFDVLFLPISQHPSKHLEDDLDFGRRLVAELGSPAWVSLLATYPHPTVYMALLGQCDALVLSRLHAVILGSRMGTPIATVTYDDKVTEFVKLLGAEDRLIELKDFTLERLQPALEPVLEQAR